MKRKFNLLLFLVLPIPLFAQTSVTGISVSKFQATYAESSPKFFPIPIVADLQMVSNVQKEYVLVGRFSVPSANGEDKNSYINRVSSLIKNRIEELKFQALYEFAEREGADVILAPSYSVVTTEKNVSYSDLTVKVKGFPAKYTNFRLLTEKEEGLVRTATFINSEIDVKTLNSKTITNTLSPR